MSSVKTKWILEFGDKASAGVERVDEKTRKATGSAKKATSSFKTLKRTLGELFAGYQAIQAVKSMFSLGIAAETTDTKFKVLTGSAENAKKMLKGINDFANKTPFDNEDLKQGAELLLNYGFAQEKIIPTMKMLGDVSGGNKEKFKSLSLAYAQVQSTGKLMGQDLLQMINAGFNPLQIISEKTGKSMAQLKEEMSKGKISAKDVEDAFRTATGEGGRFYKMMDQVSETAGGKLSTLFGVARNKIAQFSKNKLVPWLKKATDYAIDFVNGFGKVWDSIVELVSPIGELLAVGWDLIKTVFNITGESKGASSAIETLSNTFKTSAGYVKVVASGLKTLIGWLKPFAPILKVIAYAYGVLTVAQWALNIAMNANPVGLIILGVAALIGVIKAAYNHVEKFRGIIDGAWAALKGFGKMIKDYVITRFKELLSGITGIGKALMHFFKGEWKEAWEAGKGAVGDLVGVGSKKQLIANAMQMGKDVGEAYDKGIAAVKYKDFKPESNLAGIMSYKVKANNETAGGHSLAKALSPVKADRGIGTPSATTKPGSSSGSSGAGRSLTMNLDIKNIFNLSNGTKQEIENIADQIVGRIVDKLRDGEIAMG